MSVKFTILGECASAKNSRKIARLGRRMAIIKSDKARAFETAVKLQAPMLNPLLAGQLRFTATIYYASEKPDLDGAVLLDALQGKIYQNDRQVREQHFYHAIDRENPRAEIVVELLT